MAFSLGMICWDGWNASSPLGTEGSYGAYSLSGGYQGRAPSYASVDANGRVSFTMTQADMDAQLLQMQAAKVGYIARLWYPTSPNLDMAYQLYEASPNKSLVPTCLVVGLGSIGSTGNYSSFVTTMTAKMQATHWKKVLGNRPLLYIIFDNTQFNTLWGGDYANLKAALDALRAAVTGAGLGTPYIVPMDRFSASGPGPMKTGLGADAMSDYIHTVPATVRAPFSALAAEGISRRSWLATNAGTIVPIMMSGWDRRPRIRRPVVWEVGSQKPWIGSEAYVTPPTPSEFAAVVSEFKSYVLANPSICPAETAIVYAWNEHDEGVPIASTRDGTGQAYQAAMASVL